jgi:hypothetical protein
MSSDPGARIALVLEFPAMLHGSIGTIRREVRAKGQGWAREYLKTGAFTPPRRMLQVPPGGPLVMHSAAEFEFMRHSTLTVERMARATREDCLEAVLRVIPVLVQANADLKHREMLSDPGFLRERLAALSPKDFDDLSSAYHYAVNGPLCAWDRSLGRHQESY